MTGISIKYHFDGECAGKVMTGISIKYHFDGECAGKVITGISIDHVPAKWYLTGNSTLMENVPAK